MSGMVPADLYKMTWAADPRVSPDGLLIAFSVVSIDKELNDYRSSIWVVPADASEEPRQLTFGPKSDAQPRWSPDGKRLAFVSKREQSDKGQLYVIPLGGGEARRLTNLKEDVTEVAWSPDGNRIAFCSRVPDEGYKESDERKRAPRRITRLSFKFDNVGWTTDRRQHLFTVAADGSEELRQITFGDFEDSHPTWAPDSSKIGFVSARTEDWDTDLTTDVYVVDAEGSDPELITSSDGYCDAPSWSPDGQSIAYQYFEDPWSYPRHLQIAVVDIGSGTRRILTSDLDRNCGPFPFIREPIWDGEDLVFAIEDQGNTPLYRVAADGSRPQPVVTGELSVAGYDVVKGTLAHTAMTPTALADLHVGDGPVTSFGRRFSQVCEVVEPERFVARSADGSEVEAWIMRPGFEPARRYPVLLNIHGGPFTQYGNRFFDEFQVYTGAGYVVVYSNPRGSSGYSEEWGRAIRGPVVEGPGMGTVDYEDVMAVIDEALNRYEFCDPDRVGVMGGSYGGFMTSWIVGHTDRFAAACSERAVNNWLSFYGSSDEGFSFRTYIGAYPFENTDAYLQMSPSTYAHNVSTPLLIMHSENDMRCDVEQAEHLFTTLRLLKKEVEMVRFPEETHELSRSGAPLHRVMRFEIILDWFDRHLKK